MPDDQHPRLSYLSVLQKHNVTQSLTLLHQDSEQDVRLFLIQHLLSSPLSPGRVSLVHGCRVFLNPQVMLYF
ncbi:hypothetical protein ES703_58391 [subsurface metagenome]